MRRFTIRALRFTVAVILLAAGPAFSAMATSALPPTNAASARTLGIEEHVSLDLPRADYQPRPLDDRTEVILRIAAVTPGTNGWSHYELYFMGLEPGTYRLADFIVRPDGRRPDELGDIQFQVRTLLPENHDGRLTHYTPRSFLFIGGYRVFLAGLGTLWVGGIVAFVLSYRKKRVAAVAVEVRPEPTYAERMRPLIEAAAAGTISADGQAQLERLFIGFWRERLPRPDAPRMGDMLTQLKSHPQAGELLRALEHWLHQRAGATAAEVNALLEPYRQVPAAAPATETAGGIK